MTRVRRGLDLGESPGASGEKSETFRPDFREFSMWIFLPERDATATSAPKSVNTALGATTMRSGPRACASTHAPTSPGEAGTRSERLRRNVSVLRGVLLLDLLGQVGRHRVVPAERASERPRAR